MLQEISLTKKNEYGRERAEEKNNIPIKWLFAWEFRQIDGKKLSHFFIDILFLFSLFYQFSLHDSLGIAYYSRWFCLLWLWNGNMTRHSTQILFFKIIQTKIMVSWNWDRNRRNRLTKAMSIFVSLIWILRFQNPLLRFAFKNGDFFFKNR